MSKVTRQQKTDTEVTTSGLDHKNNISFSTSPPASRSTPLPSPPTSTITITNTNPFLIPYGLIKLQPCSKPVQLLHHSFFYILGNINIGKVWRKLFLQQTCFKLVFESITFSERILFCLQRAWSKSKQKAHHIFGCQIVPLYYRFCMYV